MSTILASIENLGKMKGVNMSDQVEKLQLQKKVTLGFVFARETVTDILISDQQVEIHQKDLKQFKGEQMNDYVLKHDEITDVTMNVRFDKWNTVLAVLAILVGVYMNDLYPESNAIGGFVLAGFVILWLAYGKVVHIHRKYGEAIEIPSHSKKAAENLQQVLLNK